MNLPAKGMGSYLILNGFIPFLNLLLQARNVFLQVADDIVQLGCLNLVLFDLILVIINFLL